jgi:hypothetical protein
MGASGIEGYRPPAKRRSLETRKSTPREAPAMTGSDLAPIIIPIFVIFGLAVWIVLVFRADSHPQWPDRTAAAKKSTQPRQVQRVPARPARRPRLAGTR